MISIRRQLTRELLAAMLLLLGGGLLALYLAARDAAMDQFDAALRAKALAISTLTQPAGDGVRVEFSDRFLRGFDDHKPRDFFEVWDETGRPVARSESLGTDELPRRIGTVERPVWWNLTLPNARPGRALGFAFKPRESRATGPAAGPEVQLVVASDREDLDETLDQLLALAAGCAALLLGATIWVIPRVLRRGLQPLERLGEQAAAIDAASLATRFTVADLPDELRPIARRLNDLLARLEHSFERERRFSADLAHELRTPLAELRSLAECALKWPETRDAATDTETLAIAQQMEALVGTMLALARGDQGQLAGALTAVELGPLVIETWRPFAVRAASRSLLVNVALAPATVQADAVLLRSVLANLFDNAVDYTPVGGRVTVEIAGDATGVALRIGNTVDQLDAGDVAKIFDRFWRKEAARTGGSGHVGLGLSLARTFAVAMGWSLDAMLEETGRLVFTLRGPVGK